MVRSWLHQKREIHYWLRPRALVGLALILWTPLLISTTGWVVSGVHADLPVRRYVIPVEPLGGLEYPQNFGSRCTLVDSASVLDLYGAPAPQPLLALWLSGATQYSDAAQGVPWWAYVAWPGKRPLLDTAIERVASKVGLHVQAQTVLGLNFTRAATAIARNHPVILNMWRGPGGTYDHSFLAYGYDERAGRALLLVVDPNNQVSYWIGSNTRSSTTVTTTYITPAAGAGRP